MPEPQVTEDVDAARALERERTIGNFFDVRTLLVAAVVAFALAVVVRLTLGFVPALVAFLVLYVTLWVALAQRPNAPFEYDDAETS